MESHHNGFCKHINAGDWRTVEDQIQRACAWRSGDSETGNDYEPYPLTESAQEVLMSRSKRTSRTWNMDDLKKGNDGRESRARSRIKRAVGQCLAEGIQVSRKTLEAMMAAHPTR